jgi:hypothetical protein
MRDKQIEEMLRDISEIQNGGWKFVGNSEFTTDVTNEDVVEYLYNAGYRKATDVAREIFEEIEDIRLEHSYGEIDGNELNVKLFNLKKKYESEGEG